MTLGVTRPALGRSSVRPVSTRARLRRAAGFLGAVVLLSFVGASPAAAHTEIEGSDPPDGSVVAVAPRTVVLMFSEDLAPSFVKAHLEQADRITVALDDRAVQVSGRRLTVTLPALERDVYQLWYTVRDPIDLHVTAGSVVFGVGTAPTFTSTGGTGTVASPLDLGLLGLERLGLLVVIGALIVGLVLVPRAELDDNDGGLLVARALRAGEWAAYTVVAAEVSLLGVETLRIGGPPLQTLWRLLSSSGFGKRALAAAAIAVGVQKTLALVRHVAGVRAEDRHAMGSLVAFPIGLAAALTVVVSLSGHSPVGGPAVSGVALRVAHLGALGAWIGSLVVVLTIARGRWSVATPILRSFGPVALPAAALVVASGFALTAREVYSVNAAQHTTFGRALGAKILVVGIVLVLGARHHRRLRQGVALAARSLVREASLAALAVGLGAVLASTPPAVGASFEPAAGETPAVRTAAVDDLLVTVSIRPNRPGRNVVWLDVVSTRRPAPAPIEVVTLAVVDAAGRAVTLSGTGDPTTARVELGTIDLVSPGPLEVRAVVQRGRRPVAPVDLPWTVNGAPVGRLTSGGADRPLVGPLGLASMLVAMLGITVIWRGNRRRRIEKGPDEPLSAPAPATILAGHGASASASP